MKIKLKEWFKSTSQNRKVILIIIAALISVVAFIIPFFFKSCTDTTLSVLSLSFTALGTVATLFTLYIAVQLYQRFGLESKFIEKKADTVLELAELLKGKVIKVKMEKGTFLLRSEIADIEYNKKDEIYKNFYKKIVLYKSIEDYESFFKPINNFNASPWLPDEIREKIKNLNPFGYTYQDDLNIDDKYSVFDFGKSKIDRTISPIPEILVEDFVKAYSDLIISIEVWLQKHCDIKIDLKLNEPYQLKEKKE